MFDYGSAMGFITAAIDAAAFSKTLSLMGKGMFGILIVMVVIYLTIAILNKVTGRKKDDVGNGK